MFESLEPFARVFASLVVVFVSLFCLKYSSPFKLPTNLLLSTRSSVTASNDEVRKPAELPQGWWSDPAHYELEKRAIFSKNWICVSHRGRFVEPGDYVSHELAGFRFFLILGKDNIIRAFHNVCRHRAFPITRKESGSSTVLGCKYHGWSYDTKGKLTKAPHFDTVPGFDKDENRLYEIHTKVDNFGFIHVNLSSEKEVGDDELSDVKTIGRKAKIDHKSRFICSSQYKGNFNWKLSMSNQLEMDKETNQAFAAVFQQSFFSFSSQSSTPIRRLQLFPLTTIYTIPGTEIWYQLTYSPDSSQQSTLRCDVYSNSDIASLDTEEKVKNLLETNMKSKIKRYEEEQQIILGSTWGLTGYGDQTRIADAVKNHAAKERMEKKEIKPAMVQGCRSAVFARAEGIYQAIECNSGKLDW